MSYDGVFRRTQPAGRICRTEGCNNVLSIYNPTEYCASCPDPRKARRTLLRGEEPGEPDALEGSYEELEDEQEQEPVHPLDRGGSRRSRRAAKARPNRGKRSR